MDANEPTIETVTAAGGAVYDSETERCVASYGEYDGEYRSPGYWLDEDERLAAGMNPETGEYLSTELEERGYTSLKDSGTDSAYGLFFDRDGLIWGVSIGPGFDPNGCNGAGWIWGGAAYWDAEEGNPDLAVWMTEFLAGNLDWVEQPVVYRQELRNDFWADVDKPFWNDKDRVLTLMRQIIIGHVPTDDQLENA